MKLYANCADEKAVFGIRKKKSTYIMNLLLGPAFRFILSPTDLWALDITVLHQRSSANLDSLIKGNLLILNETVLPKVLLALLLLLRLIVGGVGGVAPPVIAVVALDHIIILCLLNHLNLVNAPLAVSTRASSSNCSKTDIYIFATLPTVPGGKAVSSDGSPSIIMMMVVMMLMVVMTLVGLVEWEGAQERSFIPWRLNLIFSPKLSSSKDAVT